MRKFLFLFVFFNIQYSYGQLVKEKLSLAVQQMEADPQLRHAIIGFCVVESKTGKPIYNHNAQTGLAPASTQKLFTSCAAFDLLGKEYRYKTEIGYNNVSANPAKSYLVIKPSGDPSFGSFRFASTKPSVILENIVAAIKQKKLKPVPAAYKVFDSSFENNEIPRGWIWEDIGNYYGAGAHQFNWLENQYDIVLKSGKKPGDKVFVIETRPPEAGGNFNDHIKSAEKGSGDNTFVFLDYGSIPSLIEGTIPVNEDAFIISAAITNPADVFVRQLTGKIRKDSIEINDSGHPVFSKSPDSLSHYIELYKHYSPPFDSLNYWFLKKSINLYGEALIKTIAYEKTGFGSAENGVDLVKDFWNQRGIEKSAVNIVDGSGLSPQNRVTADALVKVLQYAKTRPWFGSFYDALPDYNGMKMKSGSIGGARAYAGYHTAKDGVAYTFAVIINNYDGASADVVKKMYKLLDNLK
jgi:serine-type D-Ala-D-Ala carboxypeptidase/endopeptidase (penicillin-binding protein 4)